MKKYFSSVILLACCISYAFSQELAKVSEPVFKPGEELSYRMKYGFFTAAEGHLRVEATDTKYKGNPTWHIIAEGQTAGTFDVFYKVRNRYETFIDQKTLLPYFYAENRHEGNWKHSDKYAFDREDDKITANKGVYKAKGNVFDFVSAYYFARSLDVSKMHIGEKFDLRYFLEDTVSSMQITYVGKEKVECSLGTFNCLKFSPTIIPGRIFRKNSKLYLWVTDDGNRIPIKAHVEVIVGSLTMDLTQAKGLKYPLNPLKN